MEPQKAVYQQLARCLGINEGAEERAEKLHAMAVDLGVMHPKARGWGHWDDPLTEEEGERFKELLKELCRESPTAAPAHLDRRTLTFKYDDPKDTKEMATRRPDAICQGGSSSDQKQATHVERERVLEAAKGHLEAQ